MREANERCAIWADVDPETFVRFSEYAYTGDYQAAPRYTREEMGRREFLPPPITSLPPIAKKVKKTKTSSTSDEFVGPTKNKDLWSQFKKLYPDPVPNAKPAENIPEDDFSEVFLSHARLYVLADCYDVSALKLLCLRKLRQTLERFIVYEESIDAVVQLVCFCYEHTVESDDMRDLVNMYTACKVADLWQSNAFQSFVVETGEYAGGLISEMLKRLD